MGLGGYLRITAIDTPPFLHFGIMPSGSSGADRIG